MSLTGRLAMYVARAPASSFTSGGPGLASAATWRRPESRRRKPERAHCGAVSDPWPASHAELADALGVSQARISEIEHGEISGIDVVRAYVAALGGSIDVVARLGDRSWKVA